MNNPIKKISKILLFIALPLTFLSAFLFTPAPASAATNIRVLGHWDSGPTFDVVQSGNYLYVSMGEQVRIYDIFTKMVLQGYNWIKINTYAPNPAFGTFAENQGATKILHTGGFVKGLKINGNYLYISNELGLTIADISSPTNAYILSSIATAKSDGGHDVDVFENYAYITSQNGLTAGIKIIDVSNKNNPILAKNLTVASGAPDRVFVSVNPTNGKTYLYVTINGNYRLDVYDVTDPVNAVFAGSYSARYSDGTSYTGLEVRGNYAYVIEYKYGLRVLDISNPASITLVSSLLAVQGCSEETNNYCYNDIKLSGDFAYISERYSGYDIVNISNPLSIYVAKHVSLLPGYEEGIFHAQLPYGDYTFLSTDSKGLGVVNDTDISNPIHEMTILAPAEADSVTVKENWAYVGGHNEGVWAIDFTNKANPQEKYFIYTGGRTTGIDIQGNYLFTAAGWYGLNIIDISNQALPVIKKSYLESVQGSWVKANGNYVYLGNTDTNGGIIDITDINNPFYTNKSIPFFNGQMDIYGTNYLIIANKYGSYRGFIDCGCYG